MPLSMLQDTCQYEKLVLSPDALPGHETSIELNPLSLLGLTALAIPANSGGINVGVIHWGDEVLFEERDLLIFSKCALIRKQQLTSLVSPPTSFIVFVISFSTVRVPFLLDTVSKAPSPQACQILYML